MRKLLDEKYRKFKPFVLYPAQTWPHKNHIRLIEALAVSHHQGAANLQLVCTGARNAAHFPNVQAALDGSPVARFIHFMGAVPEPELRWLYEHAAGVVIPTKYEAGSFPLMEAMQLAAPVICSRVTSLPATINDDRFTFDPDDAEQMGSLIVRLVRDEEFRAENLRNSELQCRRLSQVDSGRLLVDEWKRCAAAVVA
jgi:glycosyltransferase involved in cell wall biosynthesis